MTGEDMAGAMAVLGQRIRTTRVAAGMTQAHLGHALGVTGTAVSYWESGLRQITVVDLWMLAQALGVDPALLLPPVTGVRSAAVAASPRPWRTGSHVLRTIYTGGAAPAGRLIGVMDDPADAWLVVAAVNAYGAGLTEKRG